MPSRSRTLLVATVIYTLILIAFWLVALHLSLRARIGHLPSTFAAFAFVFAPFWFFGFGLGVLPLGGAPRLASFARRGIRLRRTLLPGLIAIPYLIYSLPRHEFHWTYLLIFLAIPVGSAALFEFLPPGGTHPASPKLCWQDVLVLAAIGLPIEFGWLHRAFPHNGLDSLPKLLLVDTALYAFLVVRPLGGVGYDFRFRTRDLLIGLRELFFFAPIVITLGVTLHFITPHGGLPRASTAFSDLLITFFFVAIPEELFFRGLLQNLLESRIGHLRSLWLASTIFGLSHFNKPGSFNWRYVLLATIAGIFYGRAWRDRRRLFASATTHTLVDVLWTLWFR
jgi:membrane protease YdiL (CAAX protease family)